jgi:hypothetical protein
MNRRGAFSFIVYLVMLFFVVAFLSLGVGAIITTSAADGVTSNGMTGLEAFLFSNIITVVVIAMLLGIVAFVYFGWR